MVQIENEGVEEEEEEEDGFFPLVFSFWLSLFSEDGGGEDLGSCVGAEVLFLMLFCFLFQFCVCFSVFMVE